MQSDWKRPSGCLLRYALVTLCAAASTGCYTLASVGSGELAVVRDTDRGVLPMALKPGDHHLGYFDTFQVYSIRTQEREEQLQVLASNGEGIVLDTSIRYHVVPEQVVQLDQELGPHYYESLIGPELRSQARRVVGRYEPEDIYSKQREAIERLIREGLESHIKGRHIVLEAVLIRNVTLPTQIQEAINHKLEKEQAALEQKYVRAQAEAEEETKKMVAEKEAEREKVVAQGEAEAARIRAQSAGDAKRIDGQATADYQRLVQKDLTVQILRLREIEATAALAKSPHAKLVFLGGAGARPSVLLDDRNAMGGISGAATAEP